MTAMVMALLSLTLSGTLVILLLFLLKALWKNKVSRHWQYYLWMIAVARLLLPFSAEGNLMDPLFSRMEAAVEGSRPTGGKENGIAENGIAENGIADWTGYAQTPHSQILESGINAKGEELEQAAVNSSALTDPVLGKAWREQPFPRWFLLAWILGVVALLVRRLTIYQSFIRYIKAGRTGVSDVSILNAVAETGAGLGIKKPVEVFTNPLISSPLLLGFLKPSIILPEEFLFGPLAEKEFNYIILHELTHLKSRDMWYKWLVQLTVCIHWFNPAVWFLGREINRACELACDEAVIKRLDAKQRRAYGDTLLNCMDLSGTYRENLASVTLSENGYFLKERLGAIMKFGKKSKLVAAAAAVLCCGLSLTTGVYAAANTRAAVSGDTSGDFWQFIEKYVSGNDDDPAVNSDDLTASGKKEGLKTILAPYFPYGLRYDENDNKVYYQDREVRGFADKTGASVYQTRYYKEGSSSTLYVAAVRDETGSLTGLTEITEKEFENGNELEETSPSQYQDIKLINRQTWPRTGIDKLEVSYGSDSVCLLPSSTNEFILEEYSTKDLQSYYAKTEMSGSILKIDMGERPETSYISCINLYVPAGYPGVLQVQTESGKLELNGDFEEVYLKSESGKLEVNGSARGEISASSGLLSLNLTKVAGDLKAAVSSGKIELSVADTQSFWIEAKAGSGKIKNTFHDGWVSEENHLSEAWGDNPAGTLNLTADSGIIEIGRMKKGSGITAGYENIGIKQVGDVYFYNNELVRTLMDRRSDESYYLLAINDRGKVDIKVRRDEKGVVTGVEIMTEQEAREVRREMYGDMYDEMYD